MTADRSQPTTHSPLRFWTLPVWRETAAVLSDLRLAIVLLLVIAAFSVLGTVLEQGETLAFYQENYPEDPALFGFLSWKVILFVGLDRVYRTWWFLTLLILFGSSLAACTFTRQFPALKAARQWRFYRQPRQFEKLATSIRLDWPCDRETPWHAIETMVQEGNYRLFRDGNALYARKGLIGRIGPIVVHAGILIILAGAILGSLTGFTVQEMIPSGATVPLHNVIQGGSFARLDRLRDRSLRVNRFWIDYRPDGSIEQFHSDLSAIDADGEERDRQTISVNHPWRDRGLTLYQADWGIAAVRLHLNDSPVLQFPMAPLNAGGGRFWGTWVPTRPDLSEGISLITKDLQGMVLLYGADGKPLGTVRVGRSVDVNGIRLSLDEVIGSTGLQIKSDPGIPLVYLGFALLMGGAIASYASHAQLWVLRSGDGLYIGGRSNRAQVSFERDFTDLLARLNSVGSSQPITTSGNPTEQG